MCSPSPDITSSGKTITTTNSIGEISPKHCSQSLTFPYSLLIAFSIRYTLWVLVTADGWTFFQDELDRNNPGQELSRLFTSTFVFVGNFVFTNLFIGQRMGWLQVL